MSKRIEYIDTAKGILILMVVFGHIFPTGYSHDFVYTFHMPAFFIISGVLFNYSSTFKKSILEVLKSKIYTTIIPMLFFEIIGAVDYNIQNATNQSIFGFMYNTLHLNMNHKATWFLITLFFGEMLFILIHRALHSIRYAEIAISTLCLFISILLPTNNHWIVILAKVLFCEGMLSTGYYAYNFFQRKNSIITVGATIITAFVAFLNGSVGVSSMTINNPILFLLGAICGTYMVLQISNFIPETRLLQFIGKGTLTVLGTHYAVYEILMYFIPYNSMVFVLTVILEIPLIYAFDRFLPFLIGKPIKHKNTE